MAHERLAAFLADINADYAQYAGALIAAEFNMKEELAYLPDSVTGIPRGALLRIKSAAAAAQPGAAPPGGPPASLDLALMHAIEKELADSLFAPFAEDLVPRYSGDGSRLCSLLETPLNVQLEHIIPTHERALSLLFSRRAAGSLGVGSTVAESGGMLAQLSYPQLCMGELFSVLAVATKMRATAQMSEMSWCGWWDSVTQRIVNLAASLCGINIRSDRDVQDSSITIDDKRRDFLLWAQSVLIMGGEHKKAGRPMPTNELIAKHKGANASLYGLLEFILLYASAGPLFQLYAIPVAGTHLVPIGVVQDVTTDYGRAYVMRAFINTIRFARTVIDCNWLPEAPVQRLFMPMQRVSPYADCGPVTVTVGMRHVLKQFLAPAGALPRLLQVYDALMQRLVPHAIDVVYLQVGAFGMHNVGRTYQLATGGHVHIEVKLGPVGSRHKPNNAPELYALACTLLELLAALHALGLVHRDIRRDNIIHYQGQWVLIDWEVAGPAGELLPFAIRRVPPDVAARARPYTTQDDLWQVAQLLHEYDICSGTLDSFAADLGQGRLGGAAAALQVLRGIHVE